ncbi:hypothetical protein B0H14DRAFT_2567332 [Mycena olivaceomarginata]|nr:hypothetical protein B0H14DRAFT_2567332 [Mycena olivaceomarginata]
MAHSRPDGQTGTRSMQQGVGWVTVVTEVVSGMDRSPRRAPAIYFHCAALTILDRFARRNDFRSASMDSPQRPVQPTHYHAPTFGDNATPTSATRYSRPARHHSTLPPPLMEHPQSDLLQGIHGMLQGLVERVSALEVTVASAALASAPARGIPAQRGRITSAKRQRILHSRNAGLSTRSQDDSCENIDPTLVIEEDAATDDGQETTTDAESVCSNVDLDKKEQGVLQGFVTSVFRRYCHVSDSNWPNPGDIHENPITGQVYPIPRFQDRVDDEYNKALCVSVAHQAVRELRDRECWPKGLKLHQDGSDPNWDFVHLLHCSKEAFRNLKCGWKRNQTPELVAKKARADRRLRRREELRIRNHCCKSIQSKNNAAEIAQDFQLTERFVRDMARNISPTKFLAPNLIQVRLLGAAGYPTDHASVSSHDVLEVLIPGWRIENYGKLLRESRRRNSGKHVQKWVTLVSMAGVLVVFPAFYTQLFAEFLNPDLLVTEDSVQLAGKRFSIKYHLNEG